MKNKITRKGFSLINVIIIILVVAIVSGLTTGIIVINAYRGVDFTNDKALNEFLNIYANINNNYYKKINKEKMLDKAADAMMEYLDDTYTTFMDKEEANQLNNKLNGTFKGIGISFANKTIIDVIKDTPAYEAGLKSGDIIVNVNGEDVSKLDNYAVADLIKKSKNSVNLIVRRDNKDVTFVNIPIKEMNNYVINSTMIKDTKTGYVFLSVFSKESGKQLIDAIENLEGKGMDRLILDLRDNTGGYLDEASNIANAFIENGKKIYGLEDKKDQKYYYDNTNAKKDYPVVVLLNENSASASEILAAALKDSYGAIIIGKKSFGKGKVQQTVSLTNGSLAKYTTAKWYRPNGTCIDGVGIIPDYIIELDYEYDDKGNKIAIIDTQFNKAVEVINGL